MTENNTVPNQVPPQETGSDLPPHPSDVMLNLIVILLAPMFLCAAGGDITFARAAAIETIGAFRVRNQASLLAVAQIVGFGLAALGSLSLSMADDISVSMTLRLRGSANALNRSAEQNRRALNKPHLGDAIPDPDPAESMSQEDHRQEAAALANVAAMQQATVAHARMPAVHAPIPDPVPATPIAATPIAATPIATTPVATTPIDTTPIDTTPIDTTPIAATPIDTTPMTPAQQRQHREMWAAAISDVAGEFTADLLHLPLAERKLAVRKVAAMSTSVTALLSGEPLPRLHPGAFGEILRPNAG